MSTADLQKDALEVAVIPENPLCGRVADILRAELAPGASLLGWLSHSGSLKIWDPADTEAKPVQLEGHFRDFLFDEVGIHSGPRNSSRLLAIGSHFDLKLLEVVNRSSSVSVRSVSECSANRLLQTVREHNHSVSELQTLRILSWFSGRCCVLINNEWMLQLQWQQTKEEPQTLSCCKIQQNNDDGLMAVHHCVCRETLFTLSSSGLISIHGLSDGSVLATIDLPSYLTSGLQDDDLTSSPLHFGRSSSPSYCFLQVSHDLSTAVAITESHSATAIDLNHYFRIYPGHLLCAAAPKRCPLQPQDPTDPDSVASSSHSLSVLGATFSIDRSWEARLASMYSSALDTAASPSSSSSASWWSSLPHLSSHHASLPGHSRVPPTGLTVSFCVPESCSPSLLTISEFSALLTFVTPGNAHTTVALWDFESGSVSFHRAEEEAAPVQHCGQRQHILLLKKTGVFQVLFSVSQQDLLSSLMLFGSAATVDTVCHLNSWGRCSIPVHALEAGLKNRQLDTVDFYLKSKENVLNSSDQQTVSTLSLTERVQQLCPALDLLCSSVKESNSEAQSRQFSEQLLSITLSFINSQIRSLLSDTHSDSVDVQSCVEVLDRYLTELRSYMRRFPWSVKNDSSSTGSSSSGSGRGESEGDEWDQLPTEEVVRASILTNQIPRAQAALRRRGQEEHRLSALRMEGLRQVYSCLQRRDLETANTLLTNMGFSVKKQLHSICQYTDDKDLREFVVKELSRRSYFTEEEAQRVSFIREMEKLGSLPVVQHPLTTPTPRALRMVHTEETDENTIKELVLQRKFEEAGLWVNVRLDWVKNWDQNSQTTVVLSRLKHTELSSCDPSVLWRYLTSLHDQQRVVEWIQSSDTSDAPQWPELTPELVNNSTACSTFMREDILDLLARRHVFIPGELSDFERLLWRLAQGGGAMSEAPPVPFYRSTQGLDFHSLFISFCLEHGLKYLLYTYLQHYRLTPRNCPLLSDQTLFVTYPWFEMLIKIQEITRDLTEPGLVFQACLTSAQVLLPGSQASLSSLLLEGHSQLALAAIMFAPGGIDQFLVEGEKSGRSERTVDPQLLKMALAPYPKLKAALFPSGPRGNNQPLDVSLYHLLQSLHPLDPSKLFSWQTANTLNSTETSELPHFSSPHLVSKFALVENLDYLYYLRHGRPSFAYGTFLIQQLNGCSDVRLLLQQASQQVYRLALQCFNLPSVCSAAVCFYELLGICSLQLRVDIRAMNTILQHWSQQDTPITPSQHLQTLVSKGMKLVEAEPGAAEELIGHLEAAVSDVLEQKGVGRSSYEAALEWALPVQFCQLHSLKLSSVYPSHCADDGQFIHFLLFVQLHKFPPQQVRSLAAEFGPTLRSHLSLAFRDLQVHCPRWEQVIEEQPTSTENEDPTSSEHPRELFQVLLQSQNKTSPFRFLLQEALVQHCPTLAVLAACQQGTECLSCLCVWILTSVDEVTAQEATAHLSVAPQHHNWTLHDLSIIWRTLLGRGLVTPLLRGFQLFRRDCPLVLVLRMFELCCDYRNFSEAKSKLLDFQRIVITLRSSSPAPPGGLPLEWVENQFSVLLLTMLQRCSSQYDLHRLLQLLTDVNKLFKSNGLDFRKLSQLSQLLQGSDITLSPRLLQSTSASDQQEELQAIVDTLQARGRYAQARQVSQLAGLPVHSLLLSQLQQEVTSLKHKRQWRRLETRVTFWKKCHDQLRTDSIDPESASEFLLSQVESVSSDPSVSDEDRTELLDLQEKCLLLGLTSHWLSQISPIPISRLEALEKKLWVNKVQQKLLSSAIEKEGVFNLPPTVSSEMNTYEALMKEFSFTNVSGLNTTSYLSLDGLPGKGPDEEPGVNTELSSEERAVLSALIGQLLDEGSIFEASRVCRYFSLYHRDLWLVLRCRGLASGEISPELIEEATEAAAPRGVSSSASFSSLTSFAIFPLPEDDVSVQLQKTVDQCRHGNNYCKQVLSLYQLSKELQCSFAQICCEDSLCVLEKLLVSEQPERFRKAQAFIKAQGLPAESVADLVSTAVVQALLASTQELQPERQVFRPSEGRDSLMQLLKLCEDPNLVGSKLLESLTTVPLRDLNCIVELLIVAHDCFSLTCNMEGIVRVLQAARHLSHTYLAPGEHYGLLVRLLTGIRRYNEMTYIFDLLHQNHRFEMLLRKKMATDRGQSSSLKTALLDYLKRCLPGDSEKHNMVALCFSMRREIGENHEMAARTQLKMIESQDWVVTPDLKSSLVKVLGLLKDAAESYTKDSCIRQATRCVRSAKLVALQLHFLNQGLDLRVINLRPAELLDAVIALPRCYQVFVVSEAYSYSPDWAEVLYQKVVLKGDFVYLEEFKQHRVLTTSLFEDIFKKLDGAPGNVTANVKKLLTHCNDIYSRYKLAYQQNLSDITKTLLQDKNTGVYLNDRLAR